MKCRDIDLLKNVPNKSPLLNPGYRLWWTGWPSCQLVYDTIIGLRYRLHVASRTFTSEVRAVCG